MTKSELLAQLDARQDESNRRVREIIQESNPDYLPTHDAGMEEIKSGRHDLRMTWVSISAPQQRVMKTLSEGSRKLVRSHGTRHFYDVVGEPHASSRLARATTVRALVAHTLLRFEASRDDDQYIAVLSERGHAIMAMLKDQN